MHGKGIMKWSNGKMYEGEFDNDNRTGKGKLTDTDGKEVKGIFKDGKLIEKEETSNE